MTMSIQPMPTQKKMTCECRRATRGNPGKMCDECQRRECFEWQWDKEASGATVVYNNNDRDVIFNPGFSVGTAAVRGTHPFKPGCHHYWEIEMSTEVYGTDMMIGVGTDKTDLKKYSHNFVSLIGIDDQSWGISYSGEKKHGGQSNQYTKPFGQNTIIGVHLDLWAGTLEFYVDRKPLGLAFEGLRDKVLYPIISSTAARSGMNLIFCRSYPQSLQLQSMLSISKTYILSCEEEENASLFKVLNLPPGLKSWMKSNYWWIVSCRDRDRKREEELNNRYSDKEARQKKSSESSPEAPENADEDSSDSDEEPIENFEAVVNEAEGGHSDSPRRQARRRIPQQCSQQAEGSLVEGATSCMQFLAATSSRAHFLGRVSPIFVGMPEGGFAVLSNGVAVPVPRSSSSTATSPSSSSASSSSMTVTVEPAPGLSQPKPVIRSRSAPAPANGSAGSTASRIQRQPSSSEDEDDSSDDGTHSARKEPKRLRLRTSIESEAGGEEIKEENSDDGE